MFVHGAQIFVRFEYLNNVKNVKNVGEVWAEGKVEIGKF